MRSGLAADLAGFEVERFAVPASHDSSLESLAVGAYGMTEVAASCCSCTCACSCCIVCCCCCCK